MLKYAVVLELQTQGSAETGRGRYIAVMEGTRPNTPSGFVFNRTLDEATLWDKAEEAVAAIRFRNKFQGSNDLFLIAPVEVADPVPPRQRVIL